MLARRTLPRAVALPSVLVVALFATFLMSAAPARAETPWWHLRTASGPRNLPPGGEGKIVLEATNVGDAPINGAVTRITIADELPAGLAATEITGVSDGRGPNVGGPKMTCAALPALSCTYESVLQPFETVDATITVKVAANAQSGAQNRMKVSGGGLASASLVKPLTVSGEPTSFGVETYELTPEEAGGLPATQAGSHPFQLTTTLMLNRSVDAPGILKVVGPTMPALAKDLHFDLPAGLIGNPTPFPQCTAQEFNESAEENSEIGCPLDTVVGAAVTTVYEPKFGVFQGPAPLFNLAPSAGEPARFGFVYQQVPVVLDTSVATGGEYNVVVSVSDIPEAVGFLGSQVTFWGVPGDPRHNTQRGWNCLNSEALRSSLKETCSPLAENSTPPLLTLPTSCAGPLRTSVETDSWAQQGAFTKPIEPVSMESLDGCNRLGFEPSISVAPDGKAASTPTGLTVGVHVPQERSLNPTGLAEADVKDTTVALPAGVQLSPAAADGLEACSDAQIGFTGVNPQSGVDEFTPGAPSCPEASKVATVKIDTPLLPDPLEGAVYLAAPQNFSGPLQENPFGSLVALYIVAEDPTAGVLVKLPGKVSPNPVTGQLVSTFEDTPQLPFEELELHFFGSDRAPLAMPPLCGSYTTNMTVAPWSGNEPVGSSSTFDITSGPNGAPCSDPLPFAPGFQAGTTNLNAGSFTPLTTTLSREDGQQSIQSVQLHFPPGLSGLLSSVKLCGEAEANAGTCGHESEIGETVVSVGLGGDPYTVTGGKVYITGPYEGAPFGLSIVNPAKAGPFDLQEGRPVVVRAKIEVNPTTAALTITTNSSGEHAIPTIIDGIPLQIKHVNVTINRPGFTFNPTNCAPSAITGAIDSAEGASSPVQVPFQVTNCASLKFTPKFSVLTSGKTSKADGASLTAEVAEPSEPQGSQANIAKVKVELPKALPSRLKTLQKACLAKVFEANPAACPAESLVGRATVHTPLLPVPLTGPAIFVSHGGEAFPSLTIVLQGDNVTIDLVGATYISPAGVTSTTFNTVPDTPFSTFELTLPEGPYSALAANGNLCKPTTTKTVKKKVTIKVKGRKKTVTRKVKQTKPTTLVMPTEFVAQNGAEIHENTAVGVTGCAKAAVKKAAKKKKTKKKGKKGGKRK